MPRLRLLFPLDGSEATLAAVERSLKKLPSPKDVHATFLVVVSQKIREMPREAREHLMEDEEAELFIRGDEADSVLLRAEAVAKKLKTGKTQRKAVVGTPYESILVEAKNHDVMVCHALDPNEYAEKMRGGFLEKLCRNAPCDVWLVR